MKIQYIEKKMSAARLEVVRQANVIIAEYDADGFTLTLRQLYYQFVSRDMIPNTQQQYKRLGDIISDGRRLGLIDWNAIEDRTRKMDQVSHWDSPEDIISICAREFRIDKWATQDWRPEVWIEKEALVGVIEPTCQELDIAWMACRGYPSDSVVWLAARRFKGYAAGGQRPLVIHLGDHDPSGVDMTGDIGRRLHMFGAPSAEVDRIALTMDQVRQYEPPPNPAKLTDSRADAYIAEYGDESWELDALEPRTIDRLIRDRVEVIRDDDAFEVEAEKERIHREHLSNASGRWAEITEFLAESE